jgi:wobble nucleotide-excising tRNase
MLDKVDKERTLIKNAFLRIQEIEERISGAEDSIENTETIIKENTKCKRVLTQNIQEIQDTMRRSNLRIIGIDENEEWNTGPPMEELVKIPKELKGSATL